MGGNVDKWREAFRDEEGWNNRAYQAIKHAEAPLIASWLRQMGLKRVDILELGCGNGLLALLLCRRLAEEGIDFSYRVTDLLPEAVDSAREKFRDFPQPRRIGFQALDIHDIIPELGRASQTLIVSTGHASAASYRWAVPLVAESLKPGGTLICDFINHLSPRRLLPNLPGALARFNQVRTHRQEPEMDLYHFGRFWVADYFGQYGLKKVRFKGVGWLNYPLLAMFKKEG